MPLRILISLFIAVLITTSGGAATQQGRVLLINATIVDGLNSRPFIGHVVIQNGRIISVEEGRHMEPGDNPNVIDLDGLVLAPGFIDIHNHSDRAITRQPQAEALISQGLTTIVGGADGGSQWPVGEYLRQVEAAQPAVNVATLVGHGTVRRQVMGNDFKREATAEEVAQMAELIRTGIEEGAFGLSSGLEYDPGFYSNTEELIALAEVAAGFDGFYMSHMRDEEENIMDAINEVIRIGFEGGLPVQISHVKMGNASVWDRADEALDKLAAARERGLDITADWYPYPAWASSLSIVVSSRRFSDPEAVAEGLAALGGANRIQVTRYEPDPSVEGLRLDEIAELKDKTPVEMYIEMMEAGGGGVIGHTMKLEDVNRFAASPLVMVCSDGGIGSAHPRGAGTFPRVLGRYVRDEQVMSLELAVHKMTSMPARRLGLEQRGVVRRSAIADLVAFDPETVGDRSTFEDPELLSTGIEYVWVGGELVWHDGAPTGARPGQVLRKRQNVRR